MTVGIRVPGELDVSTKLFGKLTVKDLVRLASLPAITYFLNPEPVLLGVAAVTGLVWYWWTPFGQHLDVLVYNTVRWLISRRRLDGSGIASKEKDHVLMQDGTRAAVIEVSPTNLEMKTYSEQGALHNIYQDLLDTINYPVHIHSLQEELNLAGYTNEIKSNRNHDAPRSLKREYLNFCSDLSDRNLSTTKHYIVLRAEKNTSHWLLDKLPIGNTSTGKATRNELDRRTQEILDTVNTAELQAERLTGRKLSNTVDKFPNHAPNPAPTWSSRRNGAIRGSDHYRQTLYVSEFPATVEMGWPLQLLRTEGLVDVTQVIEPRDAGKATKKLQRLSEKLNAEIDSFLSQGYRGTNKLETLLDDTEWILDLLADRQATPVDYGVYITSHSTSSSRCSKTRRQVQNRLDTLQIDYQNTTLRTDQAYKTLHPLRGDALGETQLAPSNSAAAGFPFGTQQTQDSKGVIYGVDTSDDTPILADRFSWSSHSMARMGMVGSGKSYAAKLELLRSAIAYEDLQIIVVDPKKEYSQVVEELGGTTVTLDSETNTRSLENRHVCFQVEERGQTEDAERLADLVQEIYSYTSRDQRRTLVVVDEARILMNHEKGRQVLNQFVLEARDTNTAVTLISQNASHFTYCREGREILDNMPGKVFMRHDRVPEDVVDYFQLSQQERQELYELKTGTDSPYSEALLKITGRLDTRIKVESTDREHSIIAQEDEQR